MTTSMPQNDATATESSVSEGARSPSFNTEEIWKIALEQIKLHVSPQNFTAWFKNTSLATVNNGIATIECPNSFARDWLDTNHHKLITQTVRNVSKQDLEVTIVVGTQTSREDTTEELASNRYESSTIAPEEAPLFNIPYTHQNLLEEAQSKASLNREYTFENFVVGSSNKLAHAAAEAVADNPGRSYNPFFVYGGVGLGKTHLCHAIGNRVLDKDPNKKIMYCSSETFLNEMVESIRNNTTTEFRNSYRKLNILIVDDIQFISEWQRAQEELFHTFNTLYQSGSQIILVSDRPPKKIENLMDRLRSRFEGGMVADISRPDYELRVAILQLKAEEKGITLPEDIQNFMARSIDDNIRELEGALMQISTHAKVSGVMPNENEVAKILKVDAESKRQKTSPRELIQEVCKEFDVSIRDIRGKRRTAEIALPRQVCMYVLRKELELPLEQIARELGRSDHTTVIHAIERVEEKMEDDEEFRGKVEEIGA